MTRKNNKFWTYDPGFNNQVYLNPCPFCGNEFEDRSYDRGIIFKCNTCNYSRGFEGLLQLKESSVKIPYSDGKGGIKPESEIKNQEYYHYDATYHAVMEMNKRVLSEIIDN